MGISTPVLFDMATRNPDVLAAPGQRVEVIGVGAFETKRGERIPDEQPILTAAEAERADTLARDSQRVPKEAGPGYFLLDEEPHRASPRAGQCLGDISYDSGRRLPDWFAIVDLTTNKVVDAGEVSEHGR